jgi:hypothetical protein
MGKGKKGSGGGKGGAKGGAGSAAAPVVLEFPPDRDQMSLLYRKASLDVLPHGAGGGAGARKEGEVVQPDEEPAPGAPAPIDPAKLIAYELDLGHRLAAPGYCEFLRQRKYWMSGDPVPEEAIPKLPPPPKAAGDKDKKKAKK